MPKFCRQCDKLIKFVYCLSVLKEEKEVFQFLKKIFIVHSLK